MEKISTTNFIFILILSLLPTFVMLFFILYSDRKSREPLPLIAICIVSGVFTICVSLLLGNIFEPTSNIINLSLFSNSSFDLSEVIILAIIEEYAKLFVLYIFISHNDSFDDIYDGFVYSSIIALSFAAMESLFYVFNQQTVEGMKNIAILRDFTAIPLHLVCGIIMGHYVAIERFSKSKRFKIKKIIKSLFIPTIVHTVYNSFFSYFLLIADDSIFVSITFILFVLSIYLIGIIYTIRTINLNEIFISSKSYPKKYDCLMNKEEFISKINEYNYL